MARVMFAVVVALAMVSASSAFRVINLDNGGISGEEVSQPGPPFLPSVNVSATATAAYPSLLLSPSAPRDVKCMHFRLSIFILYILSLPESLTRFSSDTVHELTPLYRLHRKPLSPAAFTALMRLATEARLLDGWSLSFFSFPRWRSRPRASFMTLSKLG